MRTWKFEEGCGAKDTVEMKEVQENLLIASGLIGVQFVYAGNSVLQSYLMCLGLGPSTIVIATAFSTFIILSPIAIYFERNRWPNRLSLKLIFKLFLISFAGVTLFQALFLEGNKLTSPAVATAMPNLAPGLIFIIAWTVRLENVNIRCLYSKVKILGTGICMAGAITMSIMHSKAPASDMGHQNKTPDLVLDKIIGCTYLLCAVFVLSSNVVLQASALRELPAPISLCAATSLIGVTITVAVELFEKHSLQLDSTFISTRDLIGYSVLAGTVSGGCVSFNGWAMKKRGPVLVSMFSPISTVISVVLSIIALGESFNLGSILGMLLMFGGLYLVLWAKGKEARSESKGIESEVDAEKALLS